MEKGILMSDDLNIDNRRVQIFSKGFFQDLNKTIYVGERLERNIRSLVVLGAIVFVVGLIMTLINIFQHKGFVTYTTAAIAFFGLFMIFEIKVRKNRNALIFAIMMISLVIFSYYALMGVNDGFAILWSLIIPIGVSFLVGAKYGIGLSLYFEAVLIVMFYTPVRSHMAQYYSETFMNRFPILYLADLFVNFVAVSGYHISTLAAIEYEQKLKKAADVAISADKAKSRFLAQMSHEIRTPINAVLGMNEMILREAKDDNIRDYSGDIQVAGKNLLSIINTILDFSKIEDGKMEIIPAEYDFPSVLNNLINSVAARAKAKSLDFNVDVDETLPVTLFGDDLRVSQVIINLLTNAVKYTEEGCISLSIKEFARDGKKITLDVDVSDTGIGIRAEDMDKLFESFGRLDEKRNRGIEGTGLGMAIVTKLLEMMGSELKVSSEYGVGSSFSFRIVQEIVNDEPIGKLNERFERARKQESSREYLYAPAASVLVVDDNEMNCKVAKNLMKQNGIVPDFAFSGEEAIGKIRKKFYNIVFLDHMMPKMDGIETLEHLKVEKLIPEGTAVVALTANAVVGAKETYLNAGFDDYLSKPIEIEDLEAKLWKYLPSDITEKRILSAEENTAGKTDKRKTSPERIKTGSREISEKDVREILEFEPSGDKGCFGQGGDDEVLEFAPDEGDVQEFGPGETDILEFGPDEDGELKFGDDDASGIDITVLIETLNDMGLDTDAALRYCAGDKDFYRELLEEYVSSSEKKSADLEGFFAAGDMKEYKTLVHSMKSSSKTIGKLDLFEAARDLEAAALAEDMDYVAEHHPVFLRAYLAFCKTLSVLL